MTSPVEHEPGCVLDPVNWLLHTIEATTRLVVGEENARATADRLASASLLNALEHFARQPEWRTVSLLKITQYCNLMDAEFDVWCTCRRFR